MVSNLDILNNTISRRIYNLCLKEGLTKKEISNRLYGKWLPNAILPKINELSKAGYIEFRELGKNIQRKRGKYHSTMIPVLESMKTLTKWSKEEKTFLESQSLRKEFWRINNDLELEDYTIRQFRIFLDDLMIFRLLTVPKLTKSFLNTLNNMKSAKNNHKQSGTIDIDRIVQKMIEKFGENYEYTSKNNKTHTITGANTRKHIFTYKTLIKTDYTCLAMLMPESLCRRVKFTSQKGQILGLLEENI